MEIPAQPDFLERIEVIQETLLAFKRDRNRLRRLNDMRSQLTSCLTSLADREEISAVQLEISQVSIGMHVSQEYALALLQTCITKI